MPNLVQRKLEDMIPELDAYKKEGLFSELEISKIVEERQRFENRLNRRISKLEDYLRYAKYELDLEHIRRSRILVKKQQYLEKKLPSKKRKRDLAVHDYAITRRIHTIFRSTLKKYSGNISLWLTYIDVASFLGSKKILSQIYGMAMQKHPNEIGFWVMAASFEANECENPTMARTIFQRAIRLNSNSMDLWLEFFRFEVIFSVLRQAAELANNSDELSLTEIALGKLPLIIFEHKMDNLKFPFIRSCIEILDSVLFRFNSNSNISISLLQLDGALISSTKLIYMHTSNPEPIVFLAQRTIKGCLSSERSFASEKYLLLLKKCLSLFQEAFSSNPTGALITELVNFTLDILRCSPNELDLVCDSDCTDSEEESVLSVVFKSIQELITYSLDYDLMNGSLFCSWIDFQSKFPRISFVELAKVKSNALFITINKGITLYPSNKKLYLEAIKLTSSKKKVVDLINVSKKYLSSTDWDSLIIDSVLVFIGKSDTTIEDLVSILSVGRNSSSLSLSILGSTETTNKILNHLITLFLQENLVSSLNLLLEQLLQRIFFCPDWRFYYAFAKLSTSLNAYTFTKSLFENIITNSSGSKQISAWISYAEFELKLRKFKEAGMIYRRAVSLLDKASLAPFECAFRALDSSQ